MKTCTEWYSTAYYAFFHQHARTEHLNIPKSKGCEAQMFASHVDKFALPKAE